MPVSISFYRSARSTAPDSGSRVHGVARHDRSRISVGPTRAMQPPDAPFEFFLNIWGSSAPASTSARGPSASAGRKKRVRRDRRALVAAPLIDISQVAHVVTTMTDFRNDYAPLPMQATNLWDDPALDAGIDPADTSAASIMSPIHSKSGRSDGSTSEEDVSEASGVSAAFRPAPALQPDGRAAQVVYPTADAGEASGAQLAKIKPADAAAPGAAPRALKDGGVVFSAAFAEPMDWTWAVRFLLALHEPVRHALFVMDRFLDRCHAQYEQLEQAAAAPAPGVQRRRPGHSPGAKPSAVPAAAAAALETHVADFFTWFKTCFVEFLRGQHELKTRVLLPLLSLRADAKRDVLDRYGEAFQLVEQAQQLERALCVSRGACSRAAWLRRLDVLRREVRTLRASLLAALALEDRVLQPALSNTFTEHTFVRYVLPRVFRAVRAKRVLVPWVVERAKIWGGDREHAALLAMLPFSARLLYRKIWRPFFVSNVAVAMKRLLDAADDDAGNASAASSAFGAAAMGESASAGCGRACGPAAAAAPAAGGSERREERCGIQ